MAVLETQPAEPPIFVGETQPSLAAPAQCHSETVSHSASSLISRPGFDLPARTPSTAIAAVAFAPLTEPNVTWSPATPHSMHPSQASQTVRELVEPFRNLTISLPSPLCSAQSASAQQSSATPPLPHSRFASEPESLDIQRFIKSKSALSYHFAEPWIPTPPTPPPAPVISWRPDAYSAQSAATPPLRARSAAGELADDPIEFTPAPPRTFYFTPPLSKILVRFLLLVFSSSCFLFFFFFSSSRSPECIQMFTLQSTGGNFARARHREAPARCQGKVAAHHQCI